MQPPEAGDPGEVGGYRLLARLGAGGMGVVYLGRSPGGRAVAVKVVRAGFARDARYRARFRREVAAARTVTGAFTAPLLAADAEAAVPWLVTEYLPGLSLREAIGTYGGLPPAAVRLLAAALAEALVDIHRAGLAHRDLKRENIMLTAGGPRVIDFGIARPDDATAITVPGALLGTPGFMSPEQVAGAAGPPSDVYSLGATLEYAYGGADAAGARGVADRAPGGGSVRWTPTVDRSPAVDHGGDRTRYDSAPPGLALPDAELPDAPLIDAALRALVADCRRPDADARPTAAELVRRLAPGQEEGEALAADWLPPQVTAAIDENASAAGNPPTPASPRPGRRRVLLGGVAAAVVAVAGGTAAVLAARSDGSSSGTGAGADPRPRRTTPAGTDTGTPTGVSGDPAASATTPTTPSLKPVPLTFEITGTGTLTMVAYGVNGKLTRTKKTQKLPWRKTVEMPQGGGSTDWQIKLTLGSGTARCRVLLDGRTLFDQRAPRQAAVRSYVPLRRGGGRLRRRPGTSSSPPRSPRPTCDCWANDRPVTRTRRGRRRARPFRDARGAGIAAVPRRDPGAVRVRARGLGRRLAHRPVPVDDLHVSPTTAGRFRPYGPVARDADHCQAVLTTVPTPSSAATSSAGAVVSVTSVCTRVEGPT